MWCNPICYSPHSLQNLAARKVLECVYEGEAVIREFDNDFMVTVGNCKTLDCIKIKRLDIPIELKAKLILERLFLNT